MAKKDIKTWWSNEEVNELKLAFLKDMYNCETQEGVDVSYYHAKYMASQALTPDNYPMFLILMETGNPWIIDTLIGEKDPYTFFSVIQPNTYILKTCLHILYKLKPGELYSKLLLVILGIFSVTYKDAIAGSKLYALTIEDVNSIGKHLEEDKDQSYPTNNIILTLLDSLTNMIGPGGQSDKQLEQTANHANNIRGKFLDMNKSLTEVIPENILVKGDYKQSQLKPSVLKNA